MSKQSKGNSFSPLQIIQSDFPAGIVVFLVALPLCLGISIASGAPPIAGVLSGIVGGIVVSLISGSRLSVSGPAAGLTAIVAAAILDINSFPAFLTAVVLAGVIQIVLGTLKAGLLGQWFPSPVIKGMLSAIGIILIIKQIPHALGWDADFEGDFSFFQFDKENSFSEIYTAFIRESPGAVIISVTGLILFATWNRFFAKRILWLPGPLLVILAGVTINHLFGEFYPSFHQSGEELVNLPVGNWKKSFTFPDFSSVQNYFVLKASFVIALVASLESLLSIDAIDKLDPERRTTNMNRELLAQGFGNVFAGLIGGIPVTAVIVRSAANLQAGAKTKVSGIIHALLLIVFVFIFPNFLKLIPLSALAAILLMIGYKLVQPSLVLDMYKRGMSQFVPFMVTILAILFSDLLIGIAIGFAVSSIYILRRSLKRPFIILEAGFEENKETWISFSSDVSFLHKPAVFEALKAIPPDTTVVIDASKTSHIDPDVLGTLDDFRHNSIDKNIKIKMLDMEKFNRLTKKTNTFIPMAQQSYERLFQNNRKWVAEKLSLDPLYFSKMANSQAPNYLFIGCSDSRVPANEITGTDAGELFVHRNIANLVVHTDVNLMSVVQYSIEVLHVKHVIVCGHYGCGGVKAAIDGKHHGLIDKWLRNIKDVHRMYYDELSVITDPELKHRRLVELNVREQVYHLCMTSIVQKAWKNERGIHVHGWVYDIENGLIKDLDIDIEKEFKDHPELDVFEFDNL